MRMQNNSASDNTEPNSTTDVEGATASQPGGEEQTALDQGSTPSQTERVQKMVRHAKHLSHAVRAARLHRVRLTAPGGTGPDDGTEADEPVESARPDLFRQSLTVLTSLLSKERSRRRAKKDRLQNWDRWSRFRLWRRTRPLWGSLFMLLGSLFLLALPIYFLTFAFIVSSLWASLFLGGLLLVMALIQLFLPSYAVITGSVGIVISLVSFITSTFGGFGIGMLLGIIGGALSVAWRPIKPARLMAKRSTSTTI